MCMTVTVGESSFGRSGGTRLRITQLKSAIDVWSATCTAHTLGMNSIESNQFSATPSAQLPRASLIRRLTAIGLVLAGIAGLFVYAGGWLTPRTLSPALMIDTFEQVNGPHPGFRRNHAKGVCVTGYFESNGHGLALSKASVFLPGRVPIIGRFALAGGQGAGTPVRADRHRPLRPR